MLGLEFAEGAHQRHRQVEAEVMNRKECQAVSRTDGSVGNKPRSGLKRWDRQKQGWVSGSNQQPATSIVPRRHHYPETGSVQLGVAASLFLKCLCLLVCWARLHFDHPCAFHTAPDEHALPSWKAWCSRREFTWASCWDWHLWVPMFLVFSFWLQGPCPDGHLFFASVAYRQLRWLVGLYWTASLSNKKLRSNLNFHLGHSENS